ncbi:MAG TPA: SDR family NAD(P)-dependent oxidoreductase [Thermoanaerobaculia bacterium]|nr:SDR family NAD(P)-dependent oxidoreductase [Thermoanaerobaculia bacterium]
MKDFKGKVAVVTGAASGIGRALAERCAAEGMKVVLADVEARALARTAKELSDDGATLLAVPTDVSKASEVENLARRTIEAFGAVHLLFNNAGVAQYGPVWEATVDDWEWVLGVNLWGVIHGIRTFVPLMLAQDTEGHVVNTASMAGLTAAAGCGVYSVTKNGVVNLSETLYYDLKERGAKINVSVLCPGAVNTGIATASRNRPAGAQPQTQGDTLAELFVRRAVEGGLSPRSVAAQVFDAIRDEKCYILTHPDWKPLVQMRMESILHDRNPA